MRCPTWNNAHTERDPRSAQESDGTMNIKLSLTVLALAMTTAACADVESTESEGTGSSDSQDPTTMSSGALTSSSIVLNPVFLGLCAVDRQCGDSNDCTADRCIEGVCKHIPVTYPMACVSAGEPGYCEANKCLVDCDTQPDGSLCWTEKMVLGTCAAGACAP